MPAELRLPVGAMFSFLLVMARVAGAFLFVPLPGVRNSPDAVRVILVLGITVALHPVWPPVAAGEISIGLLTLWVFAETSIGLMVGVAVSFLTETFMVAAQAAGLQAGYAYASTVDPSTQADSGILQVIAQLGGSLVFFALGLDREVIRIFARSLTLYPAGSYAGTLRSAEAVARLGSIMFSTGLRLAMPVLALLLLIDIALALLGRINAQLQLLTLAFPVKMLAALAMLVTTLGVFPAVFQSAAGQVFKSLTVLLFGS